MFVGPNALDDLILTRIDLYERARTDQWIECVVLGPDVPIEHMPRASVLRQEQGHFAQTLKHSMHEIRLFQNNVVPELQRR